MTINLNFALLLAGSSVVSAHFCGGLPPEINASPWYTQDTLDYMQIVPRWVYTTATSGLTCGSIGSTCSAHDDKNCFLMQAGQCDEITNYQAAMIDGACYADCTGVIADDSNTCELVNAYTDNICSDHGFPNVWDGNCGGLTDPSGNNCKVMCGEVECSSITDPSTSKLRMI